MMQSMLVPSETGEDDSLIAAAAGGDRAAFGRLYLHTLEWCMAFCWREYRRPTRKIWCRMFLSPP